MPSKNQRFRAALHKHGRPQVDTSVMLSALQGCYDEHGAAGATQIVFQQPKTRFISVNTAIRPWDPLV